MDLLGNLTVETISNLLAVFAGVALALWTDRRRDAKQRADERERLREELMQTRTLLLSSVVSNTSEAKTLHTDLDTGSDPYGFNTSFDLAVWEAVQAQFVRLASMDERVRFSRFFSQIKRLNGMIEYHRQIRTQIDLRQTKSDSTAMLDSSANKLRMLADDVRLEGIVIVNDCGDPVHKRLLGLHAAGG